MARLNLHSNISAQASNIAFAIAERLAGSHFCSISNAVLRHASAIARSSSFMFHLGNLVEDAGAHSSAEAAWRPALLLLDAAPASAFYLLPTQDLDCFATYVDHCFATPVIETLPCVKDAQSPLIVERIGLQTGIIMCSPLFVSSPLLPRKHPRGSRFAAVAVASSRLLLDTSYTWFLRFLFPPWLDARQNFPGILNIAGRPKPDSHRPHFYHWRRLDRSRRNMTLECNKCAPQFLSCLAG